MNIEETLFKKAMGIFTIVGNLMIMALIMFSIGNPDPLNYYNALLAYSHNVVRDHTA